MDQYERDTLWAARCTAAEQHAQIRVDAARARLDAATTGYDEADAPARREYAREVDAALADCDAVGYRSLVRV